MRRPGIALLGAVAAFALLAGVAVAATRDVNVGSFYFEDATVGDGRINAQTGDRLRFIGDDAGGAGKPHTVESTELGWSSGALGKGVTWTSPILTTPGTYRIFCQFHWRSQNHETVLVVTGTAITPAPTQKATPRPTASPASPAPSSGATPSPSNGGSASATPGPGGSGTPGASGDPGRTAEPPPGASATLPAASVAPGDAADSGNGSDPAGQASPGGDGDGATDGAGITWTRSASAGLLAIVPLGLLGLVAVAAARRRARTATRP